MKFFAHGVLTIFALFAFATSSYAQSFWICTGTAIPSGYITVNSSHSTTCPSGTFTVDGVFVNANELLVDRYTNVPVGSQLQVCALNDVPVGWDLVAVVNPFIAQCPGTTTGSYLIKHVTCEPTDTLCYPPSGTISASPPNVSIPYDQVGSTTISWTSANSPSNLCVWVSVDGATATNMACSSSPSGSSVANWIQIGHKYTFSLYVENQGTVLATTNVTGISAGTPSLTSSSDPVIIPAGQTSGGYTLSWKAPGYTQVTLYGVQNLGSYPGQMQCLGSASSGSGSVMAGISLSETASLYLTPYTGCVAGAVVSSVPPPVLASLTSLTAKQGSPSTLTASSNPVTIPAGQTAANYTLSWNAPGYTQVTLYGKQNFGSNPGQMLCLGSASTSAGSVSANMLVGEIASLYLAAYTGCTAGGVVASLPPSVLASILNLTTN